MNLDDAVAVPWMARFTRNSWPQKVVWVQDDVIHNRFYWLASKTDTAKAGDKIVAQVQGNRISFEHCDASTVTLLLSDQLLNLDEEVTLESPTHQSSQHRAIRTINAQAQALLHRLDRASMYSATVEFSFSE